MTLRHRDLAVQLSLRRLELHVVHLVGDVSSASPYAVRQIPYAGRGSEVDPKVALGFAESCILTEDCHFPQLALKPLKLAR